MKAEADRAEQAGAADTGRNSVGADVCAEADLANRTRTQAEVATTSLMEVVVERGNLKLAYQRVVENKGAAGVDQLAVSELKDHLQRHWPRIRTSCAAGRLTSSWPKPSGCWKSEMVGCGISYAASCGDNGNGPTGVHAT